MPVPGPILMNKSDPMTEVEASSLAEQLLDSHAERAFEISMPDEASYALMRMTFAKLGRETGPDGEFFVVKVFAQAGHAN
jgi:hypothetical protein